MNREAYLDIENRKIIISVGNVQAKYQVIKETIRAFNDKKSPALEIYSIK